MINTYQKGNRTQQKAKRYLESLGYQVEVVRRDKWRKDQDFFGLWDLMGVKKHGVIFVQVKTNNNPTKEWYEKYDEWASPLNTEKLVFVYKDYARGDEPSKIITLEKDY